MARRATSPRSDDPEKLTALRTALVSAAFDLAGVREALGAADDALTVSPLELPFVERRLGDDRLDVLVRLFLLGLATPVDDARRALAPLTLQDAEALGVLAYGRARAHGLVQLTPVDGLVLASDFQQPGEPVAPDHVMGVGASSRFLAGVTIRRAVELAVDLGTGCGYQALLAARHAGRVIATDVNPRAIAFATFNAALNEVGNIEHRVGDLFEPLGGVTSDLLVSNPPYVISPDSTVTYRDSPRGRDGISRAIIEGAPAHLRDGGLAHVLASWTHDRDEAWDTPIRAWVDGRGCDAWLIHAWTRAPHDYAALWNRELASDPPAFARAVDRWVDHLRRRNIRSVSYGAVILRRRRGSARVRADEMGAELGRDASDELARLMRTDDILASLDDAELLDRRIIVAPDVTFEQSFRWEADHFALATTTVALDRGLTPRAEVDPIIVAFLSQADGRSTVREILARVTEGGPEAADHHRSAALSVTRNLLATGLLRFAEASGAAPAADDHLSDELP